MLNRQAGLINCYKGNVELMKPRLLDETKVMNFQENMLPCGMRNKTKQPSLAVQSTVQDSVERERKHDTAKG